MTDDSAQKPRAGEWAARAARPKGADLTDAATRLSRQSHNQPTIPEQTLEALALEMGLEYLKSLNIDMIDPKAVEKITFETASKYQIIAMSCNEERKEIKIAVTDPANIQITDDIAMTTGFNNITLVVASEDDIKACIQHFYDKTAGEIQELVELNESKPEEKKVGVEVTLEEEDEIGTPPIVKVVNVMLRIALHRKASDISIEPFASGVVIRIKVNGRLESLHPPYNIGWHSGIISRIKVLANIDMSEKRHALSGGFQVNYRDIRYDMRVSTLPGVFGEMVTIRVLDPRNAERSLASIGLSGSNIALVKKLIHLPSGVILVTGPTGSGKTTSLYAALQELNTEDRKIITIEDPVEYRILGINQVQVNSKTDFGFAEVLRESLRQAPNVILIGEMRDSETASIAMKAALTGHLVFSTLHTNNAVATITRLVDMGVPRFIIANALRAVVAQRLVSKLCKHCKKPQAPLSETLADLGLKDDLDFSNMKGPKGCSSCHNSGFGERMAIHEILAINPEIASAIHNQASEAEIVKLAAKAGMITLRHDGCQKALKGLTTFEEVLKNTLS